jgi:DNA-binding NtrC family response regulator
MSVVVVSRSSQDRLWSALAAARRTAFTIVPERIHSRTEVSPRAVVIDGRLCTDSAVAQVRNHVERLDTPVCVVGSTGDHRAAVRVMRAGADDYFAVPREVALLEAWLADRTKVQAVESAAVPAAIERSFPHRDHQDPGMREIIRTAARVASVGWRSVLITGESGTGKERLAQAMHDALGEKAGPFVVVNCAAIVPSLAETLLFGHERGSFTDAHVARPGYFQQADGGTLFLDEVGDLDANVQKKLLRAVEERRVRPVGSAIPREVQVRLIAATHVDLASAASRGRFRTDLYHRLAVVPLHIPPLRDRRDDLLPLARRLASQLATEHGMAVPRLCARARRTLLDHTWPGNVRELRHWLERWLILGGAPPIPDGFEGAVCGTSSPSPMVSLEALEFHAACAAVAQFNGNKSQAARALGISRKRLYAIIARNLEFRTPGGPTLLNPV